MNNKAMYNLSYGLFVLTARENEKDNGCIVNTVAQVTTSPNRILVAVNKNNYTHGMILRTGEFNVSILTERAAFDTFKHWGFQSGSDVDNLGTHTLFLADVTDAEVLSDDPSVTYSYYQQHIKPAPAKTAKKGYICTVCGYIYEGDPLPEDFICPICKHPASDFKPL